MAFDPVAFVNLLISSVIGVAAGWLIAHWYYKRSAPVERILKELKRVLPYYLHPVRYPQFYSPGARRVEPEQQPPADTDVPHVLYAISSIQELHPGTQFELLLCIRDTGRNFDNPNGLSLEDSQRHSIDAQFSGLGFARASFVVDAKTDSTTYCVGVRLRDNAGHENHQTLSFRITPREAHPK